METMVWLDVRNNVPPEGAILLLYFDYNGKICYEVGLYDGGRYFDEFLYPIENLVSFLTHFCIIVKP